MVYVIDVPSKEGEERGLWILSSWQIIKVKPTIIAISMSTKQFLHIWSQNWILHRMPIYENL